MRTTSSLVLCLLASSVLVGCADRQGPPAPVVHGDERRAKPTKKFQMPKEVYKPVVLPKTDEVSEDKIVLREASSQDERVSQDKIVLRSHDDDKKELNSQEEDTSFADEILDAVESVPDKKKDETSKNSQKEDLKKKPLTEKHENNDDVAREATQELPTTFGQDPKKEDCNKHEVPQKGVKEDHALPTAKKDHKVRIEKPHEEDDYFQGELTHDTAPVKKGAPNHHTSKEEEPTSQREEIPQKAPVPSGPVQFSWPISGTILKEYSQESASKRNDGINIAAPHKTPVKAGRAGTVVYLGNDIKGFGNLVLVKHDGPWMSAYAHLDGFTVKQGTSLKEGQVLGYVGKSGGVKEPQLHFEVRKDSTPVNPREFLK